MEGIQSIRDDIKQTTVKVKNHLKQSEIDSAFYDIGSLLKYLDGRYTDIELEPESCFDTDILQTCKLLESYLVDLFEGDLMTFYDFAQAFNELAPRLYLLIVVVVVYIEKNVLQSIDLIKEVDKLCRGIQHPIRGLLLRNFFVDSITRSFTNSSTLSGIRREDFDIVDFVLQNFSTMNRFLVQINFLGHTLHQKERREKYRRLFSSFVGESLHKISKIDSIDKAEYTGRIFPYIRNEVIQCNDGFVQEYLMDVIIQVFPDDFHLATLRGLIRALRHMQPGFVGGPIICSLIKRLTNYARAEFKQGRSLEVPPPLSKNELIDASRSESPTTSKNGGEPTSFNEDTSECNPREPSSSSTTTTTNLFNLIFNQIESLFDIRLASNKATDSYSGHSMLVSDIATVYSALTDFGLCLYQMDADRDETMGDGEEQDEADRRLTPKLIINLCFNTAADRLSDESVDIKYDDAGSTELFNFLLHPLRSSNQPTAELVDESGPFDSVWPEKHLILDLAGFDRLTNLVIDQSSQPSRVRVKLVTEIMNIIFDPNASQPCFCLTSVNRCHIVVKLVDQISLIIKTDPAKDAVDASSSGLLHRLSQLHHLIGSTTTSDIDLNYQLLTVLQERLVVKSAETSRLVAKILSRGLIFKAIDLLRAIDRMQDDGVDADNEEKEARLVRLAGFIHESLQFTPSSERFSLLLESAVAIDRLTADFNRRQAFVYDLISQAMMLFDQTQFSNRLDLIGLIASTIGQLRSLPTDDLSTLKRQCTRLTSLLPAKADQSRALAMIASIYWPQPRWFSRSDAYSTLAMDSSDVNSPGGSKLTCQLPPTELIDQEKLTELRDEQDVLSTLDRSAKLAHDCLDLSVKVEQLIFNLDAFIVLRFKGCPLLTDQLQSDRIDRINALTCQLPESKRTDEIKARYGRVLDFQQKYCSAGN